MLLTEKERHMAIALRSGIPERYAGLVAEWCELCDVNLTRFQGPDRSQPIASMRQGLMLVLHKRGLGHGDIARMLRRDRSTIAHGIQCALNLDGGDP